MIDFTEIKNPVILFDGFCNLCNKSVQFIIKHDPEKKFKFASLQSEFGQKVLHEFNLNATDFNSFILLEDGKIFTKSTGALKVAKQLKGPWALLSGFTIIPRFIRDGVYSFIAKNRYKWFGKKNECWIPTPELKNLFIGE